MHRAFANLVEFVVPRAQIPSQQEVEMRSSLKVLPLRRSKEVVLWDSDVRALSGVKQVVVVCPDVVVLLDYPQYDRGTLHPNRMHAWCSSVLAVPSHWK